jgi:hypothetical protein
MNLSNGKFVIAVNDRNYNKLKPSQSLRLGRKGEYNL